MTREQARAALRAAFPDQSICIHVKDWWHDHRHPQAWADIEFEVSVLPGWDGSKCSQAVGHTLAQAVELAITCGDSSKADLATAEREADSCFAEPIPGRIVCVREKPASEVGPTTDTGETT